MSQRVHGITLPCYSNSLAIRQEIQRFESVHPSIYTIYDLIEAIPDLLIQQQIREHVVCIEGRESRHPPDEVELTVLNVRCLCSPSLFCVKSYYQIISCK